MLVHPDANNFTQSAGSGTTTFNGLFAIRDDFAFTGNNITITGAGDNTVTDAMTLTNAGTFTP